VLDLASKEGLPEIVAFLDALGAKRSSDLEREIAEFQTEFTRLGNFLQMALAESHFSEAVDLLVQIGDMFVKNHEISFKFSDDNPWAFALKHYYACFLPFPLFFQRFPLLI